MKKLGWTDMVFGDMSYREVSALNAAAEGVEALRTADLGLAEQVNRLFRLDAAQGAEIARLRLTVEVLIDVLVETLGMDATILKYRLEAAVEEAERARKESEAQGKQVRCEGCANDVPATATNITAYGVLCDACFAKR